MHRNRKRGSREKGGRVRELTILMHYFPVPISVLQVKDICNELEVRTLCHKILQNVSILLNADRGSLFLVQGRFNGADGLKK